jgi:hypothetical protein
LPDEFKKGFTIFYVKKIDQVYKILFDSPEETLAKGNFEDLKAMGIEVDQYEEDLTAKLLFD